MFPAVLVNVLRFQNALFALDYLNVTERHICLYANHISNFSPFLHSDKMREFREDVDKAFQAGRRYAVREKAFRAGYDSYRQAPKGRRTLGEKIEDLGKIVDATADLLFGDFGMGFYSNNRELKKKRRNKYDR
jgi:hypothetical protein